MPGVLENDLVTRVAQRLAGDALRELTDDLLLARYRGGDSAAFTVLVERHAPLVLSVCRRMLGPGPEAEDAFQATFLVLVRRIATVRWESCIRGWLYRVALQVSRRARQRTLRQRNLDRAGAHGEAAPRQDPSWLEGLARIDEELASLPARYRAVILACCVEGKSRDEAGTELGLSAGQVKGLLERARELLRQRLLRRGILLPMTALMLLLQPSAQAAPLVTSTVSASLAFASGQSPAVAPTVLSLAQGVLSTMNVLRTVWTTGLTLLATLATAFAVWAARPPVTFPVALAEEKKPVEKGEKGVTLVKGVLVAVDAGKNTVTLDIPAVKKEGNVKAAGEKVTYAVAADAVIQHNGKPAKLADLKAGEPVMAKVTDDKKTVVALAVGAPDKEGKKPEKGEKGVTLVRGVLVAVDAGKNTVTLDIPAVKKEGNVKAAGEKVTYAVAADAVIQHNGKPAKLADLKAGEPVMAKVTDDKKTVVALMVGKSGDKEVKKPEAGDKGTVLKGKLKAVEAGKSLMLTLPTKAGGGEDKAFVLSNEIKVVLNGKPGELKDVKVGDVVVVKLSAENVVIGLAVGEGDKKPEKM